MLCIKRLFAALLFYLLFGFSAIAEDSKETERLENIFRKHLPTSTLVKVNAAALILNGDFNGDGFADVVVVFLPATQITETDMVKVLRPWRFAGSVHLDGFHQSLAIFHGSRQGALFGVTQVFVLLDDSARLETPSFELLIVPTSNKGYNRHASGLPAEPVGDLIILPTEAGIDTYIYWYKGQYRVYEPEELP